MDIQPLLHRLELAGFVDRAEIARSAAATLDRDGILALVRHISHAAPGVRHGVMDILAAAQFRDAVPLLLKIAQTRSGDDVVFALRALATLAQPGDAQLLEPAKAFAAHQDHFIAAQGQALLKALGAAPDKGSSIPQVVKGGWDPALLLAATSDPVRVSLVQELELLPATQLVPAAAEVLGRGNADAVALVARMLIRVEPTIPKQVRPELTRLLEEARSRIHNAPVCHDALDVALGLLGGSQALASLAARVDTLPEERALWLAGQLAQLPPVEATPLAGALVEGLARRPSMLPVMAGPLLPLLAVLRPAWRAQLDAVVPDAVCSMSTSGHSAKALEALVALENALLGPGRATPVRLVEALDRVASGAGHLGLVSLCSRLATEDAALRLLPMARDPDVVLAQHATRALETFPGTWVHVSRTPAGAWTVEPRYSVGGQALVAGAGSLMLGTVAHVLDRLGNPVPEQGTAHGGCRCCVRSRALILDPKRHLQCPQTGLLHLVESGRTLLERDHPLGRCRHCESHRPLQREGARILCPVCRAQHAGSGPRSSPGQPFAPPSQAHQLAPGDSDARPTPPKPPSAEDLQLVQPTIARAMASNIFMMGRGGGKSWVGSGVVVARHGADVAILTNRHVVEEGAAQVDLQALSLGGDVTPVRTVWVASMGVDLALVEATLEHPDRVHPMVLGNGAALVGSNLFAVGNPLGLSWSYSSGTLSAFRRWNTQEGKEVKLVQTQVPLTSGSSGGGLYHVDGHLVGIISFVITGELAGGDAHFALSMETVLEALRREGVTWHGKPLVPAT